MNNLYYIAILPSKDISTEITDFKLYAKANFETERALTSPPHITVVAPFQPKKNVDIEALFQMVKDFAKTQKSFNIPLRNFNRFDDRVIFVDVTLNDILENLWRQLNLQLAEAYKIKDRYETYHPHITVAFKDLEKAVFPKAWEYFSKIDFEREFEANHLALLRHNGKFWDIIEQFEFGN